MARGFTLLEVLTAFADLQPDYGIPVVDLYDRFDVKDGKCELYASLAAAE